MRMSPCGRQGNLNRPKPRGPGFHTIDRMKPQARTEAPTLYFDGACPVCSREVSMYQRQDGASGVHWVDVSTCRADQLGPDLSRQQALDRLHFRCADGRLVSGPQAFAMLWQTLPRWAWLGRLVARKPVLWLLEPAYRVFLAVRRVWHRQAR